MSTAADAEKAKVEALRHEYSEAATSFRHYSALRFVIFSIYAAIVAAVGGVALGVVGLGNPSGFVVSVASIGALLATYVFYTCERACFTDREHFRKVMKNLEGRLQYSLMTDIPSRTAMRPAIAFQIVFGVNCLFWTYVLIREWLLG